jgi:thiol-disulfide isomerase/thioredoxin
MPFSLTKSLPKMLYALIGTLGLMFSSATFAWEVIDYNGSNLASSIASGKKTLVWFHASWCATCKAQELVLEKIPKNYSQVKIIKVDFDKETKLRRELRVPTQSTFLVYNNGKEVDRSVGVTDPNELKKLLSD